jgi:putative acyl-CoA dehydrogenase
MHDHVVPSLSDVRASGFSTHEVLNQPSTFEGYDLYSGDKPLVEAIRVFSADWAEDHLKRTGNLVGSERVQHLARQANRHLPELRTYNRFGHRIDIVEFHPAGRVSTRARMSRAQRSAICGTRARTASAARWG